MFVLQDLEVFCHFFERKAKGGPLSNRVLLGREDFKILGGNGLLSVGEGV